MFMLEKTVPWGRSFKEYRQMFALSDSDLKKKFLGCGDGPAAFNSELSRLGGNVVSVDPLYGENSADISQRIDDIFTTVMNQIEQNKTEFCWSEISSPQELSKIRKHAMDMFLLDYDLGRKQSRYQFGALPKLCFTDNTFDLALVSHLLFLYSEHFDFDWHLQSITELLRIADEVRVFPLLELGSQPSRHVGPILDALADQNIDFEVRKVDYEFQKGGNEMLVLRN